MSNADIDMAMIEEFGLNIEPSRIVREVTPYDDLKTNTRVLVEVDPQGRIAVYTFHKNIGT